MNSSDKLPIGPYFDYSARLNYLREEIRVVSVLCTRKVLAGDFDAAKYYAAEYEPLAAAKDRLNDWFDAHKNEPTRFIGWDVQQGHES